VAIVGAASNTLGAVTLSGTGVVGSVPLFGAASITLADLTASAAGAVSIAGAGAVTLGAVTASAAGGVAIVGQAAITLAALIVAATGTSGAGVGPAPSEPGTRRRLRVPGRETLQHTGRRAIRVPARPDVEVDG
jgi:hypothetical protein